MSIELPEQVRQVEKAIIDLSHCLEIDNTNNHSVFASLLDALTVTAYYKMGASDRINFSDLMKNLANDYLQWFDVDKHLAIVAGLRPEGYKQKQELVQQAALRKAGNGAEQTLQGMVSEAQEVRQTTMGDGIPEGLMTNDKLSLPTENPNFCVVVDDVQRSDIEWSLLDFDEDVNTILPMGNGKDEEPGEHKAKELEAEEDKKSETEEQKKEPQAEGGGDPLGIDDDVHFDAGRNEDEDSYSTSSAEESGEDILTWFHEDEEDKIEDLTVFEFDSKVKVKFFSYVPMILDLDRISSTIKRETDSLSNMKRELDSLSSMKRKHGSSPNMKKKVEDSIFRFIKKVDAKKHRVSK